MPTLRELRESKFLSRKALAKLAEVSESSLVRMEEGEGKQRTHQDIAEKVLRALSNELGYVVALEDIEGLRLYNIMRDRRQRKKSNKSEAIGQ